MSDPSDCSGPETGACIWAMHHEQMQSDLNLQWAKACRKIIDRCVAPEMYAMAIAMLDAALREARK
jgi:hypothetical protein